MYTQLYKYSYRVILIALCLFINKAHSQWASIPDSNFGKWLNTNGYTQCLQGNSTTGWQLDTTCNAVLNANWLHPINRDIKNLSGVKYFKKLNQLSCSYNSLVTLPQLPASLKVLHCDNNSLSIVSNLPSGLRDLDVSYNNTISTIILSDSLVLLSCKGIGNAINNVLSSLPLTLNYLFADENSVATIPQLHDNILTMSFNNCNTTSVAGYPVNLTELHVGENSSLALLPTLPSTLQSLTISGTAITASTLPVLPQGLITLKAFSSQIDTLKNLPAGLEQLYFGTGVIAQFPPALVILELAGIKMRELPQLPVSLNTFSVRNTDSLLVIPALPSSLQELVLDSNISLTSIPDLPGTMLTLVLEDNYNVKCLPKLGTIQQYLSITVVNLQCVPNYPDYWDVSLPVFSLPICDNFNSNGCEAYLTISGKVFNDSLQNCIADVGERLAQGVKVSLSQNGSTVYQTTTNISGSYGFATDLDTFSISIDTFNLPFNVICPSTFIQAAEVVDLDSIVDDLDFGVRCKPGFDVGVLSVVRDSGMLFPAQGAGLYIRAGDLSSLYGLNCASGTSGTVTITYSGPVSLVGARANALTPTVAGNTLTYNIADFGAIDLQTAFGLRFVTDTFAQIGQALCLDISVTPVNGDNNPSNNTATYCFPILNSYDPNMKEVSPPNSILPTEDWLTYTIHFQNMGNAPALHIYVLDTLDANLDETSIQITGSSHRMNTEVKGKVARFNFPNINLVDSTTNEPESKGWLQYKVRKKANLPLGTQIKNTASIYFDFNAPVVTNTVTNTVEIPSEVRDVQQHINLSVHPNPTNNLLYINYNAPTQAEVALYSINGTMCSQNKLNQSGEAISLSNLPAGVYFVTVTAAGNTERRKVVKW